MIGAKLTQPSHAFEYSLLSFDSEPNSELGDGKGPFRQRIA